MFGGVAVLVSLDNQCIQPAGDVRGLGFSRSGEMEKQGCAAITDVLRAVDVCPEGVHWTKAFVKFAPAYVVF